MIIREIKDGTATITLNGNELVEINNAMWQVGPGRLLAELQLVYSIAEYHKITIPTAVMDYITEEHMKNKERIAIARDILKRKYGKAEDANDEGDHKEAADSKD